METSRPRHPALPHSHPVAEGMGTRWPWGKAASSPQTPTKSLGRPVPVTAKSLTCHPGDSPLTTLSLAKRRSPLWKSQSVDAQRSNLETIIIGVGLVKTVECTGFRRIQSRFLAGRPGGGPQAGWNSGPCLVERGGLGVGVPGRLLWNVHKVEWTKMEKNRVGRWARGHTGPR